MDLVHAFGTALFIMIAAEPMLEKMDRIKVKYGLVEWDEFLKGCLIKNAELLFFF